ncbi:MAG: M20 family metallo-hydrolase [Rhodovarius sp.]|nr:M20 family metallo-hydrolase [Rhodovarius sp.]MDW8314620.1 M20 family metallo-hydrolase [Rhodovarius sp.]
MPDTHAPHPAAAVSESRLWDRLMEMARIGAIPGAREGEWGVNRPCLSPEDRQARRLLIGWAEAIGLAVSIDRLGNLFLRHEGSDPTLAPVLTGSHMDSQPKGGRFDGIYGVIAALEAVQALREAGLSTRRPIEIVAWTNEEGGRFAPGCMGSMAYSGFAPPDTWDDIRDSAGIRWADALAQHLAEEADLPRRPLGVVEGVAPFAYLEAHIEQGPVLERQGIEIGAVTGIQGSRWFSVEILGRSDHAGTCPLSLRQDALQDAIRAITALNALMQDPTDVLRFTVGRMEVFPNASNSVADLVRFSIDFRHPDDRVLQARGNAIEGVIQAALKSCDYRLEERFHARPATFDAGIIATIEGAATALGLSHMRLPSGAFHDAQFLVPICPTGMIFIPCRGGISHNPAEYAEPAHCANGARVLAQALAELAAR